MDDLTVIAGISKASAKRLVAAGIVSVAALAVATPDQLAAIDKLPGTAVEWSAWVLAAKALLPPAGPLDLANAQGTEIGDRAAEIDAARAALVAAGDAVALAQARLGVGPTADDDETALARLTEAEEAVLAAQLVLDGLIGPGAEPQVSSPTLGDALALTFAGVVPVPAPALVGMDLGSPVEQVAAPESHVAQGGVAGDPDVSDEITSTITVTGPSVGRWRAGRFFSRTPVTFDATDDELAAVDADPRLSWEPGHPPTTEEN